MGTNIFDSNISLPKTAIVLGNFDGLHKGHRMLINRAMVLSKELGIASAIFAFEPHPKFVLNNSPEIKLIFTKHEKETIVKELGVNYYIQYPFKTEIANYEPEQFIEKIIVNQINPHTVIIGEDYRFGKMRKGDAAYLKELGRKYQFEVEVIKKLEYMNREISSTWIREEIKEGNIKMANSLLGREFFFLGRICEGAKLGRTIGFPTANLAHNPDKLLPPNGVYSSYIELNQKTYKGITNIGNKPTVYSNEKTIETHILDFDKDIYGEEIKVRLTNFIRPEKKFESLQLLKKQIQWDLECVERP
jgi:riboflavin kinase/FMN adenylyltransferase